jgi:hypothetical protein
MGSIGYGAKKVTDAGLFIYSWMSGRVSGDKNYREVNWREWHPWCIDGMHPFASVAKPVRQSHPVRQYDAPIISVIIPVAEKHIDVLINALDSLEGQTFRRWEAIIVLDYDWSNNGESYEKIDKLELTYPYIKIFTGEGKGAGAARNIGVKESRGSLLLFLDADDYLLPTFMEKAYNTYLESSQGVYSDYYGIAMVDDISKLSLDLQQNIIGHNDKTGTTTIKHTTTDFDQEKSLSPLIKGALPYIWCNITTLHPRIWYDEAGGFDENMSSWEDVDYWLSISRHCHCFTRIPEPLMVYNFTTGIRREDGLQKAKKLLSYMIGKHKKEHDMGCGGCGKNSVANDPSVARDFELAKKVTVGSMEDNNLILCTYNHPNIGQHIVIGPATKNRYGYHGGGDVFLVHVLDIKGRPDLYVPVDRESPKVSMKEDISTSVERVESIETHIEDEKTVVISSDDEVIKKAIDALIETSVEVPKKRGRPKK